MSSEEFHLDFLKWISPGIAAMLLGLQGAFKVAVS